MVLYSSLLPDAPFPHLGGLDLFEHIYRNITTRQPPPVEVVSIKGTPHQIFWQLRWEALKVWAKTGATQGMVALIVTLLFGFEGAVRFSYCPSMLSLESLKLTG